MTLIPSMSSIKERRVYIPMRPSKMANSNGTWIFTAFLLGSNDSFFIFFSRKKSNFMWRKFSASIHHSHNSSHWCHLKKAAAGWCVSVLHSLGGTRINREHQLLRNSLSFQEKFQPHGVISLETFFKWQMLVAPNCFPVTY